jgi:protein gp37
MATTDIEWTATKNIDGTITKGKVWNPVTGCTKVSQGCKNCYAEVLAKRFWGERKFTDVQCHPERLEQPLHWRKPSRVFVNSMSDLFHPDVPDEFIYSVWNIISQSPQHTYQILTKRPERMFRRLSNLGFRENVWIGVSVEDQATADDRIPLLLQTPAAVRFVSCEPLLGPVDLSEWLFPDETHPSHGILTGDPQLDWVIVGGESGPHARPMHPDWARSLRDQCQAAGVPFFFKQWGQWLPNVYGDASIPEGVNFEAKHHLFDDGLAVAKVGKKAAGRLLDGREWNEFPEVKP